MGWANRITVFRGLLTVALWVLLLVTAPDPAQWLYWTAWVLFTITAGTDALDGYLARRFGEVSVFGRIADPLVDKLLVLGTMVVLLPNAGVTEVLPAWVVVLVLSRELIVTALRGAVEGRGVNFQALPLGKWKMILQSFAVAGVLLWGAGFHLVADPLPLLGDWLGPRWSLAHLTVWAAALLTAVSGVDYAVRAARLLARD